MTQLVTSHYVSSVGSGTSIAGEVVHRPNIPHPVTHIRHGLGEREKLEITTLTFEEYTVLLL